MRIASLSLRRVFHSANLVEPRAKRVGRPRDQQPFQPRASAPNEPDITRRNAERLRDEAKQRRIRPPFERRCSHAYFQRTAAIRKLGKSLDDVAPRFRRKADSQGEPARSPHPSARAGHHGDRRRSEYVGVDVIIDHLLNENDDQNDDDRRDVEPAKVGQGIPNGP